MSSLKDDIVDAALAPLGILTVVQVHALADAAKKAGGVKNLGKDAIVTCLKENSKMALFASVAAAPVFFIGKRVNNYFQEPSAAEPVKEGGHVERLKQERLSRTGGELGR